MTLFTAFQTASPISFYEKSGIARRICPRDRRIHLRQTVRSCDIGPKTTTPIGEQEEGSEKNEPASYDLGPGEIAVRFINNPEGDDVIAVAEEGDALFRVGDANGARIPRACRSGLCGTCTVDILGLGESQTVRACQTMVVAPTEGNELIVDMQRVKTARRSGKDPMARFENLDTEYVAGAPPKSMSTINVKKSCTSCNATGDIVCYHCDGTGHEEIAEYLCSLCAGLGSLRCADCQGTGMVRMKR